MMTRRQIGLLFGSLGAASAGAQTKKTGTTIHQEVDFDVTPERIYEVLLDAGEFSACTGSTAEIQPQPGGTFKLFGGQIEGRNIELVPNQRVVQAWRPSYWPAGLYSLVRFELTARGSGTRIIFDHTGFPEDKLETLTDGWTRHYWDPMHKYLNA